METIVDQEMIALQEELSRIVTDWGTEAETRDLQPDYAYQKELKNFLKERWNNKRYKLEVVVKESVLENEDNRQWMEAISDERKRQVDGKLSVVVVDDLYRSGSSRGDLDGEVLIMVPEGRSVVQIISRRDRGSGGLVLLPSEIEELRLVKIGSEGEEQELDWVGKILKRYGEIEQVFMEYDARGERVFCVDKDGRLLEIVGGESSPIQPIVKIIEWMNYGRDDEDGVEIEINAPEFLSLQPRVIDIDKEFGDK